MIFALGAAYCEAPVNLVAQNPPAPECELAAPPPGTHWKCEPPGACTCRIKSDAGASASEGKATSRSSSALNTLGNPKAKVWINRRSSVYYCSQDKRFGKTRHGKYLSQERAQAKRYHPFRGKFCD